MSWRDDFDDDSLDTVKFGTSVAGDGAVAEASGTINMTMSAATANAVIVYLKDAIVESEESVYTLRFKIDGTRSGNWYFIAYNGTPAVADNTTFNPFRKIQLSYGDSGLALGYIDSAGTWQYWTGTTWSTSVAYFALNIAYWFEVSFLVRNSSWRVSVRAFGDTKSILESAWVTFASLQSYTTLRLMWGEPYNNYYYITSTKVEYAIYSSETKVWAFYNGATSGSTYGIGRAISFDGGEKYFRDPTTAIISALAGESYVKDPFVVFTGGTYYLFYAAFITATSKWKIRYATSPDLATWTDQGYITTPGDVGAYDEKGHNMPVATYNAGMWRLYVSGIDGSNIKTIGYFYGSSLGSLTNYVSNPVIGLGSAGVWNDAGLETASITAIGITISLHSRGLKTATAKWQHGVWTSTDWITWTPDGGNPVVARNVVQQTAASNVLLGATGLTVSDSTIFTNEDPIIISDGSNTHPNRVLSKADSTHITLYYPSPHAYTTPTVSAYDWGSVGIEGLDPTNQANRALGVTFQAGASLLETSSWWEYSAGWSYKPLKTPPLSLGCVWDTVSTENLKWIHNGITLSYTLLVDNLSHVGGIGAASLTQVHNLAVANLTHVGAIDNAVLTQIHQLIVQILLHTHVIGGLTLVQAHQLVVQVLNHLHGIGGDLTLLQNTLLVIQGLIHTYAIEDVGEFPTHFNLIIQNILHGHSLEAVRLRGLFAELGVNFLFPFLADIKRYDQDENFIVPYNFAGDIRRSVEITKSGSDDFRGESL